MIDEILVPAIIEAEIAKARLGQRPSPAKEMEVAARAIMAARHGRTGSLRTLYREALRKKLRRKR